MKVEGSRPATNDEWDEIWSSSQYATYFHSRFWAELWATYADDRLQPHPLLLQLTDGSRVLLPVCRQYKRFGRSRWISSPEGTYGGWITTEDISRHHVSAIVDWLQGRAAMIRQNPFDPSQAMKVSQQLWERSDFTQVVPLRQELSSIRAKMREHKVDQKVRQAQRDGLTVAKTCDEKHLDDYACIYRKCRAQWGEDATNNYRSELFRMFNLDSQWIDFWVVHSPKGKVVAAGPLLKRNRFHVVSWLTLADPECLSENPYDFLYTKLIHHYHDQGFQYFDFNPSGGHQGVVNFKAKFATERRRSDVRDRRTVVGRLQRAARSLADVIG